MLPWTPWTTERLRRAPRDAHRAAHVMDISLANRLVIFFGSIPQLHMCFSILVIALELVAVTIYFVSLELVARDVKALDNPQFSITSAPILPSCIIVLGVLGFYFAVQFCYLWLSTEDKVGFCFSINGIVGIVTSASMIALLFTDSDSSAEFDVAIFTPAFLRVFWAQEFLHDFIANYVRVHPAIKEIVSQGVAVVTITISSVGFYQFSHLTGLGEVMNFVDTLYFVVVTVTTIGYGEISPYKPVIFREGEVVVMVVIFVAMLVLPTLLNKFGEMTAYLSSQNSYNKSILHVIVYGVLPVSEMRLMLKEFMSGSRKFDPLNIVMVSPQAFPSEVVELTKLPEYQGRITLCVSDPLDRGQIQRFAARRADVLFAISPRTAVAQRGDLETILRSIAFRRHDSDLPQYLMLKRGSHATAVKRWAYTLIEREALKYRLIGMAVKLPGFVPFFLNLIKTTELHEFGLHELSTSWWKQYLNGMSNGIFSMPLPEALEGRKFSSAALIILLRTGMIPIGLVPKDSKKVLLCPMDAVLRDRDRLLVLASGNRVVERCFLHFDSSEFSKGTTRGGNSSSMSSGEPLASAGPGSVGDTAESFAAQLLTTTVTKRPKRRRDNTFPFKDHIVLIDISSALDKPDLNLEEEVVASRFQAQDMINLLLPFSKGHNTTIVYLSRWELSEDFYDLWPKHARPVYHVVGSGTDVECLRNCNVAAARGVVIFTSLEGSSAVGDAHVIMVQDLVFRQLSAAGRERVVPIVMEVDDVTSLYMCNPKLSQSQTDEALEENFTDYFLTPVFVVGGAISAAMLDTMVYQTYFNEFLPQVIDLLLFNEGGAREMVFAEPVMHFFPPAHRDHVAKYTFGDLFRLATARKCIPFGLHRVIDSPERGENLVGFRFFCTSPHPALNLRESDTVYFFCTGKAPVS